LAIRNSQSLVSHEILHLTCQCLEVSGGNRVHQGQQRTALRRSAGGGLNSGNTVQLRHPACYLIPPRVTSLNTRMFEPTPNGTPFTDSTGDLKTIHGVGAAIIDDCKCLVAQRVPGSSLAGKWEFPGGKPEEGETPEAALARC